jgi:nicotinamidase-related amidase
VITDLPRHRALLRADDTVLVVVDMQEPFLRFAWERERVVRNVRTLLGAAGVLGVPVVATLQYAARMGGLIPEVAERIPAGVDALDKLTFSCAADHGCAAAILRAGCGQVLLCGVETHICVCQTAHDLLARGLQVQVAGDAVSSRAEANWRNGLARIERAGGIITSTESAIYEMLYRAGTAEFSAILPLVK